MGAAAAAMGIYHIRSEGTQRGCGRRSQESGDRIQEFLSAERVKGFWGKRRRVTKNLCVVRRNRRVVAQRIRITNLPQRSEGTQRLYLPRIYRRAAPAAAPPARSTGVSPATKEAGAARSSGISPAVKGVGQPVTQASRLHQKKLGRP